MLGRFPRLPPRRVCRLSSPPREESGPKGIVGTSETGTKERTVHRPSNTWHLESVPVPPPATICAWLPGCTSFISALHRRLNRRRVVISRRGPLTKKQKGKKRENSHPSFVTLCLPPFEAESAIHHARLPIPRNRWIYSSFNVRGNSYVA